MLNDIPASPELRAPRGIVKINGEVMPGWFKWEVDNNTFYQADTFRARFAISALPAANGAKWWSEQTEIFVEVLAGFPANPESFSASELISLIYGKADDVTYDPVMRQIEISGRDLTSEFIDTKTTEKYQNLTASQIATKLAEKHGLTPVVTKTTTKAGKYYEIDHATLTDERSEWDLLCYLAHSEQFIVYLKGKELHFEPAPKESQNPYVLRWEPPVLNERGYPIFNGTNVSFSRNLTVSKGVVVTVRSWNSKSKKAFSVSYPTRRARSTLPGKASPSAQNYFFTIPGLTQEQALQKAQAKHHEISQHEMRLSAAMPADNLLFVTEIIQAQGTGTAFDQTFYPESIRREMSFDDGYRMSVSAKNVSPENQAIV